MPNPILEQITLPSGNTYDLHDSRVDHLSGFTKYLGVTTTELTDGSTTNPITINGESVTAGSGDITLYGNSEFIFDGTHWNAFGDLSALGDLAYKNSASGSVAVPKTYSFTGSSSAVSVSGTTAGSVSETKSAVTVSKANSGTATYTPEGSVSGTVGKPTISVKTAGSTAKVTGITSVGTLPTMPTFTVTGTTLTITAGSPGTLPTADSEKTFKTGDAAYQASQPSFSGSFSGTGARLVTDSQVLTGASFTGAAMTSTGSCTPSGSVATATTENKTVTVS